MLNRESQKSKLKIQRNDLKLAINKSLVTLNLCSGDI